jgi:hypothetical protein
MTAPGRAAAVFKRTVEHGTGTFNYFTVCVLKKGKM